MPAKACRAWLAGAARRASGRPGSCSAAWAGRSRVFYFAFGSDNLIVICDLPDNVSAAAFSLAVNNTGKARGHVTRC
jgi:hypothetical protein